MITRQQIAKITVILSAGVDCFWIYLWHLKWRKSFLHMLLNKKSKHFKPFSCLQAHWFDQKTKSNFGFKFWKIKLWMLLLVAIIYFSNFKSNHWLPINQSIYYECFDQERTVFKILSWKKGCNFWLKMKSRAKV